MKPLLAVALLAPALFAATPEETFEMNVRPLLAKNCFGCHTQTKMGGLALTSRDSLLAGGKSGPSVVPGKPEDSLLYKVVAQTHDRMKMPPSGKLADEEIAAIGSWIKDGAVWPEAPKAAAPAESKYVITPEQRQWWAFRPVAKPAAPKVKNAAWVKSPVDAFILEKLESQGLTPSGQADRHTLIRRVTFDLTGLPPTPAEVDAFLADKSPNAFAKVVDRLLASPRYGERWGRHWMDVARYSDDRMESQREAPHPNAFRYRDWIIQSLNDDMPYDMFVKAQIAGDQLPNPDKYAPGLAFYALSPEQQDDRVDATTRGFLALTVACAQCHDHKFDPIPQRDFYALQGIFANAMATERPLAPPDVVKTWDDHKKRLDDKKAELNKWQEAQATTLAEILGAKTARYLLATAGKDDPSLDTETLDRWKKYLAQPPEKYSHDFLKPWKEAVEKKGDLAKAAADFQAVLMDVQAARKDVEQQNLIRLGGSNARRDLSNADLVSLPRDKFYLWEQTTGPRGILYYAGQKLDRWLSVEYKSHFDLLRGQVKELETSLPDKYPFLHALKEPEKARNAKLAIRGSRDNLGPEIPRGFVSILSASDPLAFKNGSGRLELAEAIADKNNPLFSRVIANRMWHWHFGRGIVASPSNFGQLGEKPTHPELLDWLSSRLIENNFSLKALHREILLTATYQQAWTRNAANEQKDPGNLLLWRAPRQRLDVEAMRDAMLAAAGNLDLSAGGPPPRLTDDKNLRRTVYSYRSRRKQDTTLNLFDHPVPVASVEQRLTTTVPLQRLYLLNNDFVMRQAAELAKSLTGADDAAKIRDAYRRLYAREATKDEIAAGVEFLSGDASRWPQYTQVLLASNEFLWVN